MDSARAPAKKDKPKRATIVLSVFFLSFLGAVGYSIVKQQFGVIVSSFDPQADNEEVNHEYGIEIETEFEKIKNQKFDAIIHAVSHKEFSKINIKSLLVPNGVLFDVKSVLPKEMVDGRL